MLHALQKLFRAHPEGLTLDEIVERYRVAQTKTTLDPKTGLSVIETLEVPVAARHKRPKHIKRYLERAIAFGFMRAAPGAQGFRYQASEAFFSLAEDPAGQLVYAYDSASRESREDQAQAQKRELEARYREEQLRAEELRQRKARLREWEADAPKRAAEEVARKRAARARRVADCGPTVEGRLVCPCCRKTFAAHGKPLVDVRVDVFGDQHAVVYGLAFVLTKHADNCWAICNPDGCGNSFYLPRPLAGCEACGRWQDIPEGQDHGICQCGAQVFEWQRLLVPDWTDW